MVGEKCPKRGYLRRLKRKAIEPIDGHFVLTDLVDVSSVGRGRAPLGRGSVVSLRRHGARMRRRSSIDSVRSSSFNSVRRTIHPQGIHSGAVVPQALE